MKSARYNAKKAMLKREPVEPRPSRARQQPATLPTSLSELRDKLGDDNDSLQPWWEET